MAGSYLKQSTASQSRMTPPFLDDTDFKTAETGLTIANTDVKLMINGAASADKNSGGGTHRANGCYSLTFDATDTATVGEMLVSIKVAGALPVFMKFWVLEEAVYDALFGASAVGYVANAPVNVAQISGDSTAADNAEAFFDGTGYAGTNNVIPTVTTVTNAVTANVTQISGDSGAADNLEAAYDGTGYAHTGNTYPWTAAWDAEVQSEVQDALEANHLDHFIAVADPGGVVANSSFLAKLVSKSATPAFSSFDNTTDSLEAIRDRGDAAWVTATGFSTLDAAGVRTAVGLASANLDTQLGTLATAANLATVAGYLDTEIAAILADTNELQTDWANGGRLDLLLDGIIADLPQRVTKNTALSGFTFFMVDSADHVTGKTGLTVTATRSLDGAAFASCTNSVSEISNGWYKIDLAAGDLNGNVVALKFTATGADARSITIVTQPT